MSTNGNYATPRPNRRKSPPHVRDIVRFQHADGSLIDGRISLIGGDNVAVVVDEHDGRHEAHVDNILIIRRRGTRQ